MSDNELEDFKNLITHPGWLRLVRANTEHWAERLSGHVAQCANERDDVAALNKLRQVIAAKTAVEAFIAYPQDRVRALEPKKAEPQRVTTTYRGGI